MTVILTCDFCKEQIFNRGIIFPCHDFVFEVMAYPEDMDPSETPLFMKMEMGGPWTACLVCDQAIDNGTIKERMLKSIIVHVFDGDTSENSEHLAEQLTDGLLAAFAEHRITSEDDLSSESTPTER